MMSTEEQLREALSRERRLVRGLLLWGTLLSLVQAATLTLFFTWPMKTAPSVEMEQKPTEDVPKGKAQVTVQHPTGQVPFGEFTVYNSESGSSTMVETIKWRSEDGEKSLNISQDGLYFLYVQVTIQKTHQNPFYTVQVSKHNGHTSKVLLEGCFNKRSTDEPSSTGFLGRQVQLSAGDELSVTCSPPALINTTDTATYLGYYLLSM